MPSAAAARETLVRLLVRVVFGVRRRVLDKPLARAVLRTAGRPLIGLMHRLTRPGRAATSSATSAVVAAPDAAPTPAPEREPVLRLPLDYAPGPWKPAPRIAVLLDLAGGEADAAAVAALKRLPYAADLLVTGPQAAATPAWRVGAVERRDGGGSLAGQLIAYGDRLADYDLVLVLHGRPLGGTDAAAWRRSLLGDLLGTEAVARGALELFAQLKGLGLLSPRTVPAAREAIRWGDDYRAARPLAARLGFALYPDSPLDLPAGAMFWARPAALAPLVAIAAEAGALAERLVFHAAETAGLRWARAGRDAHRTPPEAFWSADIPRRLQRALTDCGRTVVIPGRPPHPQPFVDETPAAARKTAFRAACRAELTDFLQGGDRLVLPTSDAPEVSIILVLFNQAELTFQCLRSLQFALDRPSEVILFDNGSADETSELLDRIDGAKIVRNGENLHFLRGVNRAADLAGGRFLLLLNNDTRLAPGSIEAAARRLEAEADLGAVGGPIELLDGTLQEAGSIIWSDGSCLGYGRGRDPWDPEFQFRRDVDYCSGAFLMLPREVFERLGRLDEAFVPAYYEETDLCMRLREAGLRVGYEPQIHISHFEFGSASTSAAAIKLQQAHHALFAQRHADTLARTHVAPGAPPFEARMRGAPVGRVLMIEDQVPFPHLGAGYPRAVDIVKGIHAAGWFITLYPLSYADVDYAAAYRVLPADVEFAAERERAGLVDFLRQRAGQYDAVLVSRPHNMALFRQALEQVPEFIPLDHVVYDAEAIFALRDQARAAMGHASVQADVEAEVGLARGAAAVLAVNALEADNFRQAGCDEVRVLGHALKADPTPSPFETRADLLFVGAMDEDESPNADSLVFFAREVMPRLDALIGDQWVLRVVGRNGAPSVRALASERVQLLGRVDDLRPLYDGSRVFIAPTRFAAGIPMKVHEAAAAGLPTAATSLLAGQLGWADGEALAVGDTAEAFAEAVARLYRDGALWARVRDGALAHVRAECDPAAFAAQLAAVLDLARRP